MLNKLRLMVFPFIKFSSNEHFFVFLEGIALLGFEQILATVVEILLVLSNLSEILKFAFGSHGCDFCLHELDILFAVCEVGLDVVESEFLLVVGLQADAFYFFVDGSEGYNELLLVIPEQVHRTL